MAELVEDKIITIEDIDPRDLYGIRNANINRIKSKFPLLKITNRGNSIRLTGDSLQMELFEGRLRELVDYVDRYGHISPEVIDQVFDSHSLSSGRSALSDTGNKSEHADKDIILYGNGGNVIRARTSNQRAMIASYRENDLLFAIGPAGSGKTYTAIALAVRALKNREVKKIILTRPAVEAGEKLGFLPGDLRDKLDPYLQPLYDALRDMVAPAKLEEYMDTGVIQIAPLAYMRGRTLDHAFVILDEAQNATLSQMKMFLTRMGSNAKFIVTGDATQIDLVHKEDSGLLKTIDMLEPISGIGVIRMDSGDIIRHSLVKHIVGAFEQFSSCLVLK